MFKDLSYEQWVIWEGFEQRQGHPLGCEEIKLEG